MTSKHVLLVCDADRARGSGHVMRMITLGTSLNELGVKVTLLAHELPESLKIIAIHHGLSVEYRSLSQSNENLASSISVSTYQAIVFDGYEFSTNLFTELSQRGEQVVVIDDNGDHALATCKMIVNPNLHASQEMYASNPSQPLLCLGPDYALIRKQLREAKVVPFDARSGVLLSLGGTDVLDRRNVLEERLRKHHSWKVKSAAGLLHDVTNSTSEMASNLASSRVGVIAVGTTTWEALCLGLPFVGLIVAENQVRIANSLSAAGLTTCFDIRVEIEFLPLLNSVEELFNSRKLRRLRSEMGRSIVDGHGATRVATAILGLCA